MNENSHTDINTLGEFGLIDKLAKEVVYYNEETVRGIGDDAAALKIQQDQLVVTSTDFLVEGVHFDLSYVPLKHLGYKAISVNISDIAAMNAIPKQVTVSIALSNRFSVEAVEELYAGVRLACEDYQVDLVGGDTTSSNAGLIISVTAIGEVSPDKIAYRNTAKENHIICCTGDLGAAYLGFQILEREKQTFLANPDMQPKLEGKDYLIGRQLKPQARMDIIHELRELKIVPSSMIDISDGLASEIKHLCHQSRLGAVLYEDKLPIDQSTYDTAINDLKIIPTICALNGGEDYELLFTITQSDYEKLKVHEDISMIGYMTSADKNLMLVTRGGNAVPIEAQGWDHFKNASENSKDS